MIGIIQSSFGPGILTSFTYGHKKTEILTLTLHPSGQFGRIVQSLLPGNVMVEITWISRIAL
jgi:hypothetical protein